MRWQGCGGMERRLLAVLAAMAIAVASPATAEDPFGVAVIIGNKGYGPGIPQVSFAHNDAEDFKRYVTGVLGFRPGNIVDLRDATQAQMTSAFGNERTHEGKLWRFLRPGRSHVVVFYSGHGVPGLKDRRGYLLPVDADPNTPEINGYPVDLLYSNLAKLKAKSVRVYLDACFSGNSPGGMLIRAASGLSIKPRVPEQASGLVVLTAAQGDEVASWDEEARRGLFTRHLLAALYGAADKDRHGNGDGQVTVGEAKAYLDSEMTYAARRLFGRLQHATVIGGASTVLATVAPRGRPEPAPEAAPPALPDNRARAELEAAVVAAEVAMRRAMAEVARLQAQQEQARTDLARAKALARKGLATRASMERIRREARSRQSALRTATAELSRRSEELRTARAALIDFDNAAAPSPAPRSGNVMSLDQVRAVSKNANVRAAPMVTASKVGYLAKGSRVAVTGQTTVDGATWYRVALADGRGGYVFGPLLENQQIAAVTPFPKAGVPAETFKDCADCPDLVMVPAGAFQMGSPSYEAGRRDNEGPVRGIWIGASFAVGKHEVTRSQFEAFVRGTGYRVTGCRIWDGGRWQDESGRSWRDPGFPQEDRHPAVCIGWKDATAYVEWLSRKTGAIYRLPSEAEWEYAARAGTTTARPWGEFDDAQCAHANAADQTYSDRYTGDDQVHEVCADGHVHTSPTGSLSANGFGLHDVLGNVWEWTSDCWHESYGGAPADGAAWIEGGDCGRRVLRGGSWYNQPRDVRSANRDWGKTDSRLTSSGFRVVRELP